MERTLVSVSPLITSVHVSALSVERKMPPPCVPTNTWPIEFLANAMPSPPYGPFVCIQKFLPPARSPRAAAADRGTLAADLLPGERAAAFKDPLAKAARIVPVTTTDRVIRNRRSENASGW